MNMGFAKKKQIDVRTYFPLTHNSIQVPDQMQIAWCEETVIAACAQYVIACST